MRKGVGFSFRLGLGLGFRFRFSLLPNWPMYQVRPHEEGFRV